MATNRQRVDLLDWQFKAQGEAAPSGVKSWVPALPPPSTCHQDLLALNLIPDPFLAKQEDDVQWVEEQQWLYRTTFSLPELAKGQKHGYRVLVFEGLDTFATVWLNGKRILDAHNMFITHRIDISHLLNTQGEANSLEVCFDSAQKQGDAEVEAHPEHKWMSFNSGEARLATRKAQYHFGWDWGPRLMTCGLWRPVYIETFQSRIQDMYIRSSIHSDHAEANLNVSVEVEGTANSLLLSVECGGAIVSSKTVPVTHGKASVSFAIIKPDLWWPHSFGSQSFYNVSATLLDNGQMCDTMTKRVGLREVELVRKAFDSEEGSSFFFKINGVPIFAGGSNWIPGDSFLPRMTSATYRRWIELAKASNQVMVRVWGGGIYEHEEFYNACDEAGILVWQDFALACGMFPAYDRFREKIKLEAEDNLRKLRHHPSIALWCGNNEDYVIPLISNIEYDHDDTDPQSILRSDFPARYHYEHLLPKICSEMVPEVPYWPGSPFGGDMINSVAEGDVHQWHVWHLEKYPYQDLRKLSGRFISEFGMQAMPCLRTCRDFFPADYDIEADRDYAEDEFVQFHNKCGGGPETLHEYCHYNVHLDTRNLRRYIHATQLIQSETVATAYRSWRRLWRGAGKEYCGGALIWQLNDCWPVTSWALVDSHFRPKMSYWAMKRENQPITAGLQRVKTEDGQVSLELWAVNTSLQNVNVHVRLRAWEVAGGKAILDRQVHRDLNLVANQSTEFDVMDLTKLGLPSPTAFHDLVFAIDLTSPQHSANPNFPGATVAESTLVARNISFHEPLKEVPFIQPPSLHMAIIKKGSGIVLELKSPVALKAVLIELEDDDPRADEVKWDDNGLDLLPEEAVHIGVEGLYPGEEHRLKVSWLGGQWTSPATASIRAVL